MERALVIIKPDAVEGELTWAILKLFKEYGIKVEALRQLCAGHSQWCSHYRDHIGKDFFSGLIEFMKTGPSVVLIVQAPSLQVLLGVRRLIRETYGAEGPRNKLHTSDGPEAAAREIALWKPLL